VITAQSILDVLTKANEERHEAEQAYIAESPFEGLTTLDGHFDLGRIAELLNEDDLASRRFNVLKGDLRLAHDALGRAVTLAETIIQ
jgi:hypothetical protein